MQKKSLDSNIGVEDYNKKVFTKSMQLIANCQKIPISQVSSLHRNESVRKKYNAIDQKLQGILKILRIFTQTQKPAFNSPIDLAAEILEETKLQVEIQFRRAQEEKNVVRKLKIEQNNKPKKPQEQYPQIKMYENYDEHHHQTYFEDGRIEELQPCEKVQPPSDINQDYFYVDTFEKLETAINEIKQFPEIAVDVEHSSKSYQGLTCLIQISTRARDYLIDVFPIWAHVPGLQQIIGNPKILKIMHGAEMDTKWLQRDFNIHIINLFDTHKASRVLGMFKFSYAYLLNNYCGVTTNKIYQRADWRERPLSPEMLKYARMDTHYLLTIYDHMRIDLQNQAKTMNLSALDIFKDIQKSSHEVTLSNVELAGYTNKQIYMNLKTEFNGKQEFSAVQAIFNEINLAAAGQDESFDDIISKKDLMESISFIKDLVYNKKSKITKETRIEKIVSILQRANANNSLTSPISNIKASLVNIFCQVGQENFKEASAPVNRTESTNQPARPLQNTVQQINVPLFTRQKSSQVKFHQLEEQSFHCVPKAQNNKIVFTPLAGFLSSKYGIQEVKEDQNNDNDPQQQSQHQQIEQQQPLDEPDQQGIIEFKRMNPNVVYTIEHQDPEVAKAFSQQHGRKAKRQTEYQNRIKNKTGNIYDMLGTN